MRNKFLFMEVIFLAMASAVSFANTYHASVGSGGIEMTRSLDIAMKEETLKMSLTHIEVDYVFRNEGVHDIETLVAFPLPRQRYYSMDIPSGERNQELAETQANHLLQFQAMNDGKKIAYQVEIKAFLGRQDITENLKQLGWPVYVHQEDVDYCVLRSKLSKKQRMKMDRKNWFHRTSCVEILQKWKSKIEPKDALGPHARIEG